MERDLDRGSIPLVSMRKHKPARESRFMFAHGSEREEN